MAGKKQDPPSLTTASSGLSITGSMESAEAFDVGDTKVQHYGLLMKKPFGHKSARWQKRFVGSPPFFPVRLLSLCHSPPPTLLCKIHPNATIEVKVFC